MLSKLTVCVMFLSLALAVPAGATMITIDDFTSDTLNANWVSSIVLAPEHSGTYSFDTTTRADELTTTMSGWTSGNKQIVLLRDDYSLDVGETLYTDLTSLNSNFAYAGLYITTGTGVTARKNALYMTVQDYVSGGAYYARAETLWFDNNGGVAGNQAGTSKMSYTDFDAATYIDTLYISRTAENVYEVGYYLTSDSSQVVLKTFTITGTGNLNPGAAIGYYADIRDNASASFDNFRMDVVPEPSTLALLAAGLVGLLCYAWRKRK
ncbi:MAG: PEP-CTERM sorting domain-containing protein [Pirellulales bacterium]|nr:PEP-CTERM sorting domain-containing protein [Pirellulales bacterium]